MFVKVTNTMAITRFKQSGWTENWIMFANTSSQSRALQIAQDVDSGVLTARIKLGGKNTVCTASKYLLVEIPGARPVLKVHDPVFEGDQSRDTDSSFQALELLGVTATGKRRTFRYAGMADDFITNGKPTFTAASAGALATLRAAMLGTYIQGVDRTAASVPIISINTTGLVYTQEPHGLIVGDQVQLLRVTTTTGAKGSGVFLVKTRVDDYSFEIAGWPTSRTVDHSGTARKYAVSFEVLSSLSLNGIVARKQGRIFGEPRARKSPAKA